MGQNQRIIKFLKFDHINSEINKQIYHKHMIKTPLQIINKKKKLSPNIKKIELKIYKMMSLLNLLKKLQIIS